MANGMYYAVIQKPEIDTSEIQKMRKEYDPTFGVIDPHVTLLFPIPAHEVSEEAIKRHVANVASSAVPFLVRMTIAPNLSWDQWLNLTASQDEGRREYVAIHDALYEGELRRYLRADILYDPHIGLGHFATKGSNYSLKNPEAVPLNNERYEAAREEIKTLGLGCSYTASTIELISINDDFTETHSLAQFALGATTA